MLFILADGVEELFAVVSILQSCKGGLKNGAELEIVCGGDKFLRKRYIAIAGPY